MRVQLRICFSFFISLLCFQLFAQEKQREQIDLSYLFGYYTQEGNHSAVTGGEGTEELKDYDSRILIKIPVDSNKTLGARIGINYYTSASSDKIDSRVSSASRNDTRSSIELTYQKKKPEKNTSIRLYSGGSVETDYISTSFGGGWSRNDKSENSFYGFDFKAYFDTWNIIVPEELRGTAYADIETDKRKTFTLSNYYSQIISRRSQMNVSVDIVLQQGLLSTPFHRVYFRGTPAAKIENLPNFRFKLPLSLRWNHRLLEHLVLRNWGRVYYDNWGILSFTWEFEPPVLLPKGWSIAPFYRFHIQTGAKYFAAKSTHLLTDEFYTSDYDLSEFNSHKFGFGLRYNLPLQLSKSDKQKFKIAQFELRGMRYLRSDGLSAWLAAIAFGFKI